MTDLERLLQKAGGHEQPPSPDIGSLWLAGRRRRRMRHMVYSGVTVALLVFVVALAGLGISGLGADSSENDIATKGVSEGDHKGAESSRDGTRAFGPEGSDSTSLTLDCGAGGDVVSIGPPFATTYSADSPTEALLRILDAFNVAVEERDVSVERESDDSATMTVTRDNRNQLSATASSNAEQKWGIDSEVSFCTSLKKE